VRSARLERKTRETSVSVYVEIDGSGEFEIETDIPFLTHMLETFSKHSGFNLKVKAEGDVSVDHHHLIEDTGIVLGSAIKKALGEKRGIRRYGFFTLPMEETLVSCAVDLCGRHYFVYTGFPEFKYINGIEVDNFREFWRAFSDSLSCNLHITCHYGLNLHHIVEATFKCVARALKFAVSVEGTSTPSTKGVL
jgi:imidazoleglycerol-phosphate dehydratase